MHRADAVPRYHAGMNTPPRILLAAATLLLLSACGNKGPLVQAPSAPEAEAATTEPEPVSDTTAVPENEAEPVPMPDTPVDAPVQEDEPVPAEPVDEPPPVEDDGTP